MADSASRVSKFKFFVLKQKFIVCAKFWQYVDSWKNFYFRVISFLGVVLGSVKNIRKAEFVRVCFVFIILISLHCLTLDQIVAQEAPIEENLDVLAEAGLDVADLKSGFTRSKLNAVIDKACGAGGSADGCASVLTSAVKVAASYDTSKGSAVIWMGKKLEQNLPKLVSKGLDSSQLTSVVQSTTATISDVKKGAEGIDGAVEMAGFEIIKVAISEIAKASNAQNNVPAIVDTLSAVDSLGSSSLSRLTSRIENKVNSVSKIESDVGDMSSQVSLNSLSSLTKSIAQEVSKVSDQREKEAVQSQGTTVAQTLVLESEILKSNSSITEQISEISESMNSLSNVNQLYWPDGTPLSPEDNEVYLEQRRMISESGYEIPPSFPAPLE